MDAFLRSSEQTKHFFIVAMYGSIKLPEIDVPSMLINMLKMQATSTQRPSNPFHKLHIYIYLIYIYIYLQCLKNILH